MLNISVHKKIIAISTVFIFLSAIAYGYLLHLTVGAVVSRRDMEHDISFMVQGLGELEAKYIAAQNSINLDQAYAMGLVELTDPFFAVRSVGNLTLADNPGDI